MPQPHSDKPESKKQISETDSTSLGEQLSLSSLNTVLSGEKNSLDSSVLGSDFSVSSKSASVFSKSEHSSGAAFNIDSKNNIDNSSNNDQNTVQSNGSNNGQSNAQKADEIKKEVIKKAPFWLFSLMFHLGLLIILALIFFPSTAPPPEVNAVFSTDIGDQLEIFTDQEGNLNPQEGEMYDIPEILNELIPEEENLVLTPTERPIVDDMPVPMDQPSRVDIQDMLTGRVDQGLKNDLIAKYGGNKTTQEAVERGLRWLARHQKTDGRWSLAGSYSDGSLYDCPPAATGLALLAFQGNGNTRFRGDYQKNLKKAWTWLLKQQKRDGSFFISNGTPDQFQFYTHAICTIALCELLAMESEDGKGRELRTPAERAVQFLIQTQNKKLGGWKYTLSIDNGQCTLADLSVTTWCLMALQSAKMARIPVPDDSFQMIETFLNSVSLSNDSQYSYEPGLQPNRSMTSAGLLCREYLGWKKNNPALVKGAEYITEGANFIIFNDEQGLSSFEDGRNVYFWYSASQMLKHLGYRNQYWVKWNREMSQKLPEHQVQDGSDEDGSWDPKLPVEDCYGSLGGRLYVTALSICCLEVYYRHLPIYRDSSVKTNSDIVFE